MAPVTIENISADSKIKLTPLRNLAQRILRDFRKRGGLNIILVSDNYMRRLNQRFTKRKGSTDVLAFSFSENGSAGEEDKPLKDEKTLLGEVYVSADKARRQSIYYKVPYEQELLRLVTHGVLHLLGYDHKNEKDEKRMREKEEKYIFS